MCCPIFEVAIKKHLDDNHLWKKYPALSYGRESLHENPTTKKTTQKGVAAAGSGCEAVAATKERQISPISWLSSLAWMFAIKITEFLGKSWVMKSPLFSLGHFSKETVSQCVTEGWTALTSSIFILMYFLMVIPRHWQKVGWKTCKSPNGLNRVYLACPTSCITKGFLPWTPILMVISFEALISNQTGIICCMPIVKTSTFPTCCVHLCFIYAVFLFFCFTIGPIQDVFEPIHVGQVGSFNPHQTHLLFIVGVVKSTTSTSNGRSTSLEKKNTILCLKQLGFNVIQWFFVPLWKKAPVIFFKCSQRSVTQHRRKLRTLPKFNMEPKNDGFQKGISYSRVPFSGSMLNFRMVYFFSSSKHAFRPPAKGNFILFGLDMKTAMRTLEIQSGGNRVHSNYELRTSI